MICTSTDKQKKLEAIAQAMDNKEPLFILRGQDILAPIIVRIWALSQQMLEERQRSGRSIVEFVDMLDHELMGVVRAYPITSPSPKVMGALQVADEMATYNGPKKIAD